jgi:hypothetical protein
MWRILHNQVLLRMLADVSYNGEQDNHPYVTSLTFLSLSCNHEQGKRIIHESVAFVFLSFHILLFRIQFLASVFQKATEYVGLIGNASDFRCLVRNSTETSAILTQIFHTFCEFLQVNRSWSLLSASRSLFPIITNSVFEYTTQEVLRNDCN